MQLPTTFIMQDARQMRVDCSKINSNEQVATTSMIILFDYAQV